MYILFEIIDFDTVRHQQILNTLYFFQTDYDADELVTKQYDVGFIDTHCHLDFIMCRMKCTSFAKYKLLKSRDKHCYPPAYEGCVAVFCKPWTFRKVNNCCIAFVS